MSQLSAAPATVGRSSRPRIIMVLATLASLVLTALASIFAPAQAVTNGQPTGEQLFTNVGLFYVDGSSDPGVQLRPRCSLSVYAYKAAATANHCVDFNGQDVWVTFDATRSETPQVKDLLHGVAYESDSRNYLQGDYGAIVFDAPVDRPIMHFPHVGQLDHMFEDGTLQTATITVVGYGAVDVVKGTRVRDLNRNYGTTVGNFQAINEFRLTLTQNEQKTGTPVGVCSGDSGGPEVLGGATGHIQIGIVSTGDQNCGNTNVMARLDTHEALTFYSQFGPVWVHGHGPVMPH
ncbi:hypothetical protein CYG49_01545 [Candidatus Saccharibacteria bacterium]|nr:MAG: hypothetical protein CYG49_01545 [Candidatus Saccharibacteria bacterium]